MVRCFPLCLACLLSMQLVVPTTFGSTMPLMPALTLLWIADDIIDFETWCVFATPAHRWPHFLSNSPLR